MITTEAMGISLPHGPAHLFGTSCLLIRFLPASRPSQRNEEAGREEKGHGIWQQEEERDWGNEEGWELGVGRVLRATRARREQPELAPAMVLPHWVIKGKKNEPLSLQSRARVISRRY